MVNAFREETAPAYLLRDRDTVYSQTLRQRLKGMRIREMVTAPHSPWQNPFAERLIGSIRRECLDHVLILGDRHLRRILTRCRVEGWRGTPCARLQPPPDRTAQTVFPYAALLPASCQGL
jgi:transposase InsO family protein